MVRTRFAPSPTGYLHIGSARTALYCWLYTQQTQGQFILRIEDTDLERSTPESVQAILDAMAWLELNYSEGPYYQTKRFDRYRAVSEELLANGKAYRCYCSKERLEKLRETQLANKEKPRYDGVCRNLTEAKQGPFVIRFKNPLEGQVEFDDLVRGKLTFANSELDDLIIIRTDGSPTYNFSVVVDDWDMKITHVLRGDDHINNTPRQINILKALDAQIPIYAHLPMILGSDGKRLSKRHGAVSVMQYRSEGYLPHALLNYLARLGWSHGDQEIFSKQEMIEYFSLNKINHAPGAFNPEKLLWLNHHYIKSLPPAELISEFTWHVQQIGVDYRNGPPLEDVIRAQAERCKTLREMAERSRYFYEAIQLPSDEINKLNKTELAPALTDIVKEFTELTNWSKENLHALIVKNAEKYTLKLGKLAQPIRLAVTGGTISPPIDITLELIGKDRVLERLSSLVASLQ